MHFINDSTSVFDNLNNRPTQQNQSQMARSLIIKPDFLRRVCVLQDDTTVHLKQFIREDFIK